MLFGLRIKLTTGARERRDVGVHRKMGLAELNLELT